MISIDYKQCTAGPSQRRMAFLAEQEIFLELMKSITYANAVDKFEKWMNASKESQLYKDKTNVQNYLSMQS